MTAVGVTPGRPLVAEDIRDLQSWTMHGGRRYADGPSFGSVNRSSGLITVRSTLVATWV